MDGCNLYYGAVKGTPYKWLNIHQLCAYHLREDRNVSFEEVVFQIEKGWLLVPSTLLALVAQLFEQPILSALLLALVGNLVCRRLFLNLRSYE